jgi:PAS domain S-box-containing protein
MLFQDAKGCIVACNPAAANILGLTASQLIGCTSLEPTWQTIHEDGSLFVRETHPAKVALSTGQPCLNTVMGFYQPTGELVWLLMNSQPLFTANETVPYGVVTTIRDITEQKRTQESQQLTIKVASDGAGKKVKRSPQILCVDDDDANRYVTCRILSEAGFTVIEAATGQEALQLAAQQPDLIVLDVMLPDINGIEVCQLLKANRATANIPILHLSALRIASQDKIQGLESGADNYLTQPVKPQELLAHVRALLRIGRTEAALREANRRILTN